MHFYIWNLFFFCMNIFPQDGHFHSVFLIPSPFSYPLHNRPPRWTLTRTRAYSGSRPFCFLLPLEVDLHTRTHLLRSTRTAILFLLSSSPIPFYILCATSRARAKVPRVGLWCKQSEKEERRVIEERKWPPRWTWMRKRIYRTGGPERLHASDGPLRGLAAQRMWKRVQNGHLGGHFFDLPEQKVLKIKKPTTLG